VVNDSQLAAMAKAGDATAFDALARSTRPWLYGLCFHLLRDAEAAHDLVQEALIAAFRSIGQLREPAQVRGWLTRIAVNTCRMHLRRLAVQPEIVTAPPEQTLTGPDGAPPSLAASEALAQVDPATRRILALFYSEGLSHAELGEVLALSTAAVKSRLHRARERLRREMLKTMTPEEKATLAVDEEPGWALRTVLLVEPDDAIREGLRGKLSAAGYAVVVLPTGEAALEAAKQHRGDMLILDKHCGDPNWVEVLTLLQADEWSRENLPIAVLVDAENSRDLTLAWQAGAFVCLTRPPDADRLVSYVRRLATIWPDRPYTLAKRYYAP